MSDKTDRSDRDGASAEAGSPAGRPLHSDGDRGAAAPVLVAPASPAKKPVGAVISIGPETKRDASTAASRAPNPAVFRMLERALADAVADEPTLIRGRDEWNRLAGKINDDEPLYDERAAAFLEWFAVEHREPGGMSPVERIIAASKSSPAGQGDAGDAADAMNAAALVALASSHRSIFRVRELMTDGLVLEDLWGGGSFRVKERRQLAGVERGELFDARVVADVEAPPELLLTRILCVHPREVEPAVREQIKRAQKAGQPLRDFLFLLLRLRVRCERYQHVSALRIYTAGETTR